MVHCLTIIHIYIYIYIYIYITEPILDSKGMCVIIKKKGTKGQKIFKEGKIFANMGKNVQHLKIF